MNDGQYGPLAEQRAGTGFEIVTDKLVRTFNKVQKLAKDEQVQLGAKILADFLQQKKVKANDVLKLVFKRDPLGKVKVNFGAIARIAKDPQAYLAAPGLAKVQKQPALYGATASISFE